MLRRVASCLAIGTVLLVATALLNGSQSPQALLNKQRSPARVEKQSGLPSAEESHKLAVNTGTDYGDDKIFHEGQVFGERDRFGDHNRFGKQTRFAAATRFGDDNSFGGGTVIPGAARFGPGNHFDNEVTIGPMATLGAGATVGEGSVVGENSAFGPQADIGKDSVLAGGLIFSGGDHFGPGIHFGPNTRFGPNTIFDGDEVFSQGCTFGDNTKFNHAGAGKDTFEGNHYFGEQIQWGANDPLPPHPEEPQQQATFSQPPPAHAAPQGDEGLPPGYSKTAIPGVYQYTAPAQDEPAAGPHHVEWQWNHPTAVPLQPAGLVTPARSSLATQRAGAARGRGASAVVAERLQATAGAEAQASRRGRGVQHAEHAASQGLAAWLRAHRHVSRQGPALEMAAAHPPRPLQRKATAERPLAVQRQVRQPASPDKLDGFADSMVRVTGSALHPRTEGHAQSVFDDMF